MREYQSLIASLEHAVCSASATDWPVLLGELERLKAMIWIQMTAQYVSKQSVVDVDHDQVLDIPQVAKRLNIAPCRAYELARQGKIATVRIGKYVRVPRQALLEYVALQKA